MKELIFNTIFSLGTVVLILFLMLLIVFLIGKIYNLLIRFKFKTTTKAIEFLARKKISCNEICETIKFFDRKDTK